MRAEFLVDTVFIAVYAPLLWHAWEWLRTKERQGPPSPLRSLTLSGAQRLAEIAPVPTGLLFLGCTRTPVALLIGAVPRGERR